MLCKWTGGVIDGETGERLKYHHLGKNTKYRYAWGILFVNEINLLDQGMKGRVKGTHTIYFIKIEEVPKNQFREVTYSRVVCGVREGKPEENRTR